ncbi:MAG: hypothetical protein HGA96_05975 [Desulfobulbaceae bacterium]|nr:hypothetical protein [Desulfobulbaceae bacterium]
MLLYEYLRSRIVRDGGGGESRIVHENYYRAGRLAASSSLRELADDFGYSSTAAIRSFLDQLHRDGFIQIEAINVGKTRAQNVFIMGTHDEAGEHYFIEGVYLKQA